MSHPLAICGEGRAHHGAIPAKATRVAEAGQILPSRDPGRFTLNRLEEASCLNTDGKARGKLSIDIKEAIGS